ncbi:Gfo/Idh/MocA family protein [Cognatishimia sp. F0-27]|uniref:Gfo/Idh/MocA family protein n=1 Tax=Cognatishimia sp. F0-27 TaxID=2816855 RepID=UPI001D0C557E|nr:Gfo/Idh/MocA family oxidoreductase [Cognatishimia sp. F0-27]MCC1494836.1 Gfo/Idh/MocA family oxidoreductase [Cognatishimia sp. F0-27]
MVQTAPHHTDPAPSMRFSRADGLRKIWRFLRLYGLGRTWFKVAARKRGSLPVTWRARDRADIAMVGCGQYAFATIGYVIARAHGARFRWCYDPDRAAADGFRRGFRVRHRADAPDAWLADDAVRTVYVASNHASHADYACAALDSGRAVYLEKPVAVSETQLARLEAARLRAEADGTTRLFAGYNRPFSGAIADIKAAITPGKDQPLSVSCFVSGHVIGPDHWYRHPGEGTRICGNAGHWIDLFVHLCARRDGGADTHRLTLLSADPANPDDDFALSIATDRGDVFSLMLTARSEPFEGINETINVQQGDVIAKIDDFCRMTLWQGTTRRRHRYWPKDPGHARAILQPFAEGPARDWNEVLSSSLLMLAVADMVRRGETERTLSLSRERARLLRAPDSGRAPSDQTRMIP